MFSVKGGVPNDAHALLSMWGEMVILINFLDC